MGLWYKRGSIIIVRTLARGRGGKINAEMPDETICVDITKTDTIEKLQKSYRFYDRLFPQKLHTLLHAKFADDKLNGILHGSNCTCNSIHSAELAFALRLCIREVNRTLLGIEFEKKAGYVLHLNGFDGSGLNHDCEALPAFVLSVNHGKNYVSWTWNLKTAGLEGAKYNAPLPTKALWSAPAQFKEGEEEQ
ncbi:10558_t:CDS:2 [Dentiscutata heterogama]|uniref:10558_t:CDS:1 n=1 Tax=Dentiscutata heterogama TaxID=1316150 RepID=A0ACA9JWJ8_9GLOM|nr:10558_t:CDS:2 [Dentiscutata heterogama]